jgi:hypothetical protein
MNYGLVPMPDHGQWFDELGGQLRKRLLASEPIQDGNEALPAGGWS